MIKGQVAELMIRGGEYKRAWQGYGLALGRWGMCIRRHFGILYEIQRVYIEGYRWSPIVKVWRLKRAGTGIDGGDIAIHA
ncbi:MAG: hypothetical protein IMZ71_03745 [Chloroflexi bacterium]|nr:hypothetical protein [Chloroflexota bacterium]